MNKLERRIIDISYKHHLSHISSCLATVNTLDKIYSIKKKNEPFILSSAHSSLALYVVLEKYGYGKAEKLWKKYGTHCNRDIKHGIWASGGSLGNGIGIAVGMALSNRDRLVYVIGSDGDTNEGSWYEALRIAADYRLENLRIAIIANGYGAYCKIDTTDLDNRLNVFYPTMMIKTNMFAYPDFLQGLGGHYKVLSKEEYEEVIKC